MFCLAQRLEVLEHVAFDSLVERAEIGGGVPERISSPDIFLYGALLQRDARREVMKIPIDELPVETVVIRDEHRAAL